MMRASLLVLLLVAACGEPLSSPDLAASDGDLAVPTDLGSPASDLRALCPSTPDAWTPMSPVDAGTFCAGTPLDGTCVQTFFAKIAACFSPAGCCACIEGNHHICDWSSGAHYYAYPLDGAYSWKQGKVSCGEGSSDFHNPDLRHFSAVDGSTLDITYLSASNLFDAQCPDGSHVQFAFEQCADLLTLIVPPFRGCTIN